jgi:hypothetical protein
MGWMINHQDQLGLAASLKDAAYHDKVIQPSSTITKINMFFEVYCI